MSTKATRILTITGVVPIPDPSALSRMIGTDRRGRVNAGPFPSAPNGWTCSDIIGEKVGGDTYRVTATYVPPTGA